MKPDINWPIDRSQLKNYQKPEYFNNMEGFSVTEDGKYGILFYNIYECSMNAWFCVFAIYSRSNPSSPLVYLNTEKRAIFFHMQYTYDYASLSECFVMSFSAYKENTKTTMPFLFVKPNDKQFALLPWDFTSIYYGFNETEKNYLVLYEKSPEELDYHVERKIHKRKTGMKLHLDKLKWYDTKLINRAYEIYHTEINEDVNINNVNGVRITPIRGTSDYQPRFNFRESYFCRACYCSNCKGVNLSV